MTTMRQMIKRAPTIVHTHIQAIMPPIIPCIGSRLAVVVAFAARRLERLLRLMRDPEE